MKFRTTAAVLALLPTLACASALEQFKSFVSGTKAASGEFTQRVLTSSGKASKTASGTFLFARPGKFVWTYAKPYEQVLQADGTKLYIWDKDLNQVTVKVLGNALGSSPAAILFGSNDLDKNFTLKEAAARDGLEWLDATPKAKDSSFESISIGLKDGQPQAMELRDAFGQLSVLQFRAFKPNPQISGDPFHFVVPKGAEVIGP